MTKIALQCGVLALVVTVSSFVGSQPLRAQAQDSESSSEILRLTREVGDLNSRVQRLEADLTRAQREWKENAAGGLALLLVATFCAVWARYRERSGLLWFFGGLFLHVLTLVYLLVLESGYPRGPSMRI